MSLIDLQKKIGVTADGAWSPGTFKAAVAFYKLPKNRAAHFFAQTAHESGEFKSFSENLNYSADGLTKIFHNYFPDAHLAESCARQPEKIANKVYSNRMGNGDEHSGDGYKYRGRGLIQLTGHDNYKNFADKMGMDIDEAVSYLETPEGAAMSAAWFWNSRHLNSVADDGDVVKATKLINGGTIGLEERTALYEEALKVFA